MKAIRSQIRQKQMVALLPGLLFLFPAIDKTNAMPLKGDGPYAAAGGNFMLTIIYYAALTGKLFQTDKT